MIRRLAALFAALALSCTALAASTHGAFRIDESAQALPPAARASIDAQIDIVEAAHLPPAVLDALATTPIVVAPRLRGNPGIFAIRDGRAAVYVQPIAFAADKPILLHELMHAYHFKVLGFDRPEILTAYRHAREGNAFPAGFQSAHFLENEKEFFAVTATLYLFGDIRQPPFTCAALAKLDSDYVAFLEAQFGPHPCRASSP